MFVDVVPKPVNAPSTWRSSTKATGFANDATQTDRITFEDHGGMSVRHAEKEIQTDDTRQRSLKLLQKYNHESLMAFLSRTESIMSAELMKNIKSTAFDGYSVRWDDSVDTVSCLHTLSHAQREEDLSCIQIAWNKTGTMIGVAYGHKDHDSWCTHKGHFCAWSLTVRSLTPETASFAVETTTCLTSIAFHPESPNIVAGGTFQGEVLVWNMNERDDPLVMTSRVNEWSHQDPVVRVNWSPGQRIQQYDLVSTGTDGRILLWSPHSHDLKLNKPKCGAHLSTVNIPQQALSTFENKKSFTLDTPIGVTCITGFKEDPASFVVGTEPGFVFKCSLAAAPGFNEAGNAGAKKGDKDVKLTFVNAIQAAFTPIPHVGVVTGLSTSPFMRDLVLSCGNDGVIRMLHKIKTKGIIATWQPSTTCSPLTSIAFSPHKATVFAVGSADGMLYFYNLAQNKHLPVLSLPATSKSATNTKHVSPVTDLSFNPANPGIVAVADSDGYLRIFKVISSLYECDGREEAILNRVLFYRGSGKIEDAE
ncbi:WD40 repeat-like protein [Rhizoclosmatium globosum]|uniref:WD40 repeat-like protein n=1 Tax=Rhizoclosmatium globosum TaxID=329046 RepID=A0A1Y2B9R5_9FUNG|nr:WD40 repeat-like protein [Rhizoclosmatium globosum]|eukprot:ORY31504.1 WD40 repeat-like protein [Rhizoclosmatium globosum]